MLLTVPKNIPSQIKQPSKNVQFAKDVFLDETQRIKRLSINKSQEKIAFREQFFDSIPSS